MARYSSKFKEQQNAVFRSQINKCGYISRPREEYSRSLPVAAVSYGNKRKSLSAQIFSASVY